MKNLITSLVAQHKKLQEDLAEVMSLCQNEKEVSGEKVLTGLNLFKVDLLEHLELENNTFYVQLLASMKKAGQDTEKTEKFISEMDQIGKDVIGFLDSFSNPQSIEKDPVSFKETLKTITSVLNIHIESEEAGVYSYWGLF